MPKVFNAKMCLEKADFKGSRIFEEIQQCAKALGYETISDMLYIMYIEKKMGSRPMAHKLGFSALTIIALLKKMHVKIKPRGGPNHRRRKR